MSRFADVFDASFQRVLAADTPESGFFGTFYQRFLEADPAVARAFAHTDMDRQRSMIKKSFYYMAHFYVSTELNAYLERIAERHGPDQLAIDPRLYDLWLETLIGTVRDCDPEFDHATELAWRVVLAPGVAYMKFFR